MFILSLTYLKSNEDADLFMEPHIEWVAEGYSRGWFLASGRKVPRTGGVIFAKGERADLKPMSPPTRLRCMASQATRSPR